MQAFLLTIHLDLDTEGPFWVNLPSLVTHVLPDLYWAREIYCTQMGSSLRRGGSRIVERHRIINNIPENVHLRLHLPIGHGWRQFSTPINNFSW